MRKNTISALMGLLLVAFLQMSANAVAQGQPDGIKVHGHWTIDIRQPDGVLVSHHDFQNALASQGTEALRVLLLGGKVGDLFINLAGGCLNPGGNPSSCSIVKPESVAQPNSSTFNNLTISTITLSNGVGLQLEGTATAGRDDAISFVHTLIKTCALEASCGFLDGGPLAQFTTRQLPTPISVVTGQLIQVKVVLSFS